MPSLIEQIQRDAIDDTVPVATLLRKVKFAAAKLDLPDLEGWVESELNGYEGPVPEYRYVRGMPVSQNPVRGWEPIGGSIEQLSKRGVGSSIAALENMVANGEAGGAFHINYPDSVLQALNKGNNTHGWLAALQVDKSALVAILDRVRSMILDWSLKMERAGVHGSEFSFKEEEQKKAQAASTTINIANIGSFAGNLGAGNVTGDIAVSGIEVGAARTVVDQIRSGMKEFEAAGLDVARLNDHLSNIEAELKKPACDESAVRRIFSDVKAVLIGAAGNLAATGAIALINNVLGTGVPSH